MVAAAEVHRLRATIEKLAQELESMGGLVQDSEKNPADDLSRDELQRLKRRLVSRARKRAAAAKARASKKIGSGSGRVSTQAVKRQLEAEAKEAITEAGGGATPTRRPKKS